MGMDCNFSFPGNKAAKTGTVATDGNKVTIAGSDWGHETKYSFETDKLGYSVQESWGFGAASGTPFKHSGARPVTDAATALSHQVKACGVQVRKLPDGAGTADKLDLIADHLFFGTLPKK